MKMQIISYGRQKVGNAVTERLFIRRYSTSLIESLVRSAITLNGIVLSSDGRLQYEKEHKVQKKENDGIGHLFLSYKSKQQSIRKDYLHQTQNVDLLQQFSFILHQSWLCTKSSVVDLAKFLVESQVASVECLQHMIDPLHLGSNQTVDLRIKKQQFQNRDVSH